MSFTKRFLTAFVFVVMLAACGFAAEKSIVVGFGSDALFLDPQQQDEAVTNTVARHIFDAITDTVDDGVVVPGLAEKWETSADGLTWTFHFRSGVKFHDGTSFTAEDAKFTLDRAQTTLAKSFVASVKEVVVVDEKTLKIITKFPNAVLPEQLAILRVVPKAYVTKVGDAEFNLKPVGTGPYRFVEWVREDHIDLVVNPGHWKGEPKIKKVRFRPISNEATRTAALLTGELDYVDSVGVRDVPRVESDSKLKVVRRPGKRLIYLHIDANRAVTPAIALPKNPMTDIKVRQAIDHGIDRAAIAKVIMNGNAYPSGQLVLEGQRGYVPGREPAKYDPELSKKLLAEAGYKDGFDVTLDAPNGRYINDGQVAQAIASQLAKAGIRINLNLHPKTTFFDYIRPGDKSSLVMTGWSEPIDSGELSNVLFYTRGKNPNKGNSNRGHYSNAAFDDLIDKADATGNPAERAKYLEAASRVILDDVGAIPLYFEQDIYGMKKNVVFTPRADKYTLVHTMDIE